MTREPVYVAVSVESLHVQLYLPKKKKTGANESQSFGLWHASEILSQEIFNKNKRFQSQFGKMFSCDNHIMHWKV